MRKFLLLIPIVFAMISASAQYTLSNDDGDPIAEGSTIVVNLADENTDAHLDWHLESTNNNDITFEILSTDQPDGSQNLYCVGLHCYPPNHLTSEESLDDNNSAAVILYYKPKGNTQKTTIVYKVSEVGSPSNSFTFTLEYNILTLDILTPESSTDFVAYPNPANDVINLNYTITEQSKLIIYNIVGVQIKTVDLDILSQNIDIDSSELQSGTYFYSLITNNKSIETKRLVIKH